MQYPSIDVQNQKTPMLAVRSTILKAFREKKNQKVETGATQLRIIPHPTTHLQFFLVEIVLLYMVSFIVFLVL